MGQASTIRVHTPQARLPTNRLAASLRTGRLCETKPTLGAGGPGSAECGIGKSAGESRETKPIGAACRHVQGCCAEQSETWRRPDNWGRRSPGKGSRRGRMKSAEQSQQGECQVRSLKCQAGRAGRRVLRLRTSHLKPHTTSTCETKPMRQA